MPVLLDAKSSSLTIGLDLNGLAEEIDRARYCLTARLSAGVRDTVRVERIRPSLPSTMTRPVSFDIEPTDRITSLRLRRIDETEDLW